MRERFETWLQQHFEFERLISGAVATRMGVPLLTDDSAVELNTYLGYAAGDGVISFRRGDETSARCKSAIREIVEIQDLEAIRALRRDQWVVRELRSASRYHREFGCAPDGGPLDQWAIRCVHRKGRRYRTDEPLGDEAAQAVRACLPASNRRRRAS